MTMRRSLLVGFAVLASILVATALPAAAANTAVASNHTTDSDFQNGSLTNATVEGTGNSASVKANIGGGGAQRPSDDSSGSDNGEYGLQIEPNTDLSGVKITLSSQTGSPKYANLRDSNGDIIDYTTISNGEATLSASLSAGTKYNVTVNDTGSSYTVGFYGSPSFPYEGTSLDITAGYNDGDYWTSAAYVIKKVEPLSTSETAEYISANHSVDEATEGFTNLTLENSTAIVTWEGSSGSGWNSVASATYSSGGNKTLSLSGSYDTWRVNVTFQNESGSSTALLHDEGIRFQNEDPEFDNSTGDPDGETLSSKSETLSIDVSDPDFATAQGDEVTVEFYVDGSKRGTDTLSSNGTASYTLQSITGGDHTWHAEAADSYGGSATSSTYQFSAPGELEIHNESAPRELINNTDVEIRFYFEDSVEIYERSTSDGKVNMTGLPAGEPFIVKADAPGYSPRRIFVESLLETQTIYLLSENKTSVEPVFELTDYSGAFDEADTVMKIERGLENSTGNITWQTVEGDYFGATGEFPATLRYNARHRLVLINIETGARRVLGTYTATSSTRQEVVVQANEDISLQEISPVISVSPSTRQLPPSNQTRLRVDITNKTEKVSTWNVTIEYNNQTSGSTSTVYQKNGTGAVTLEPVLNLSNRDEGNLTVSVKFETASGVSGEIPVVYRVLRNFGNQYSLLSVADGATSLLPERNVEAATTMAALIFMVFGVATVAAKLRASTEILGLTAVGILAGFSVIGWVGYGLVFIAGVGWVSVEALRRGL